MRDKAAMAIFFLADIGGFLWVAEPVCEVCFVMRVRKKDWFRGGGRRSGRRRKGDGEIAAVPGCAPSVMAGGETIVFRLCRADADEIRHEVLDAPDRELRGRFPAAGCILSDFF